MDWSGFNMDSLYEVYQQHFHQLRSAEIQVNRSLGSASPEKTWMELLNRADFEATITDANQDPDVVRRWVRCIIRGHETEFPELRAA